MIRNHPQSSARKLPTQCITLYEAVPGASYSHHASVCYFDGYFYAMWSGGFVGEDEPGQRVLLCRSADGLHWSPPQVLVSPEQVTYPEGVLTAGGFHVYDGVLTAYFGHYAYIDAANPVATGDNYKDTFLGYLTTADGEHWSQPVRTAVPVVPNHPPQKTSTGRLILSGNIAFPYSDDPTGRGAFTMTGVYGDAFAGKELRDDPDSIHMVTPANGWACTMICEGSFYETDDRVLHMLLRSCDDRLWASESRDDGASWSVPCPTDFANDSSKFHCGRLPDGRYYVVSNARPGGPLPRCPLVLSLSADGEDFSEEYILRDEGYDLRFEGRWKGGIYGYPHTLVHEGYLYIIYSLRKEGIGLTRLALADIPPRTE